MSPQETQILQDFLNQLTQARGIAKDPQANTLIANAVAQQPDAAYLLVQRALLMDQALNAAKAQVATLQSQLQAAQPASRGFLDPADAWGNGTVTAARPAAAPMMASAPAPYQPPMPAQAPIAAPSFLGGGVGSVLGTVVATAAGVAGGAFLFQGIEHMMAHNSGSGFLGQQPAPLGNTTINNYYDDDKSSNDSSTGDDSDLLDDSTDDGS